MKRIAIGVISIAGLVAVYLFQKTDVSVVAGLTTPLYKFFFNRGVRFFLNDLFMIGLIYALFVEKKYIVFALWVQLAGIVLFLLPYFLLKLYFPAYNGPLISYLHRLVLNPTLLALLIPAYYYQRHFRGRPS